MGDRSEIEAETVADSSSGRETAPASSSADALAGASNSADIRGTGGTASRTVSRSRGESRGKRKRKSPRRQAQSGKGSRRSGRGARTRGESGVDSDKGSEALVSGPVLRINKTIFSYGNYDQYYEQRHQRCARVDLRVQALLQHFGKRIFEGKAVLDMGCNSGFVSLLVAALGAASVEGVDIDLVLISKALRRLRQLKKNGCKTLPELSEEASGSFPVSCVQSRGIVPYHAKPIQPGALPKATRTDQMRNFPHNVEFRSENVLVSEVEERRGRPYDMVLCLKLTKWVHLHWGDDGLKLLLHKCHRLLRVGGLLVLEAQEWTSYQSKKHLTPHTRQNRSLLRLRPQDLPTYLVQEVGFEHSSTVVNDHLRRPLQVYRKVPPPRVPVVQGPAWPPFPMAQIATGPVAMAAMAGTVTMAAPLVASAVAAAMTAPSATSSMSLVAQAASPPMSLANQMEQIGAVPIASRLSSEPLARTFEGPPPSLNQGPASNEDGNPDAKRRRVSGAGGETEST